MPSMPTPSGPRDPRTPSPGRRAPLLPRPATVLVAVAGALVAGLLAGPGAMAARPTPHAPGSGASDLVVAATGSPTEKPTAATPAAKATAQATTKTTTKTKAKTTAKRTTRKGTVMARKCKTRTGVNDGKRTVRCRTVTISAKTRSTDPTPTDPTPTDTTTLGTPTDTPTTSSTTSTSTTSAAARRCEAHWAWVTEWNTGHQSALSVRHVGSAPLEPWTVTLQLTPQVTSMWPYPFTGAGAGGTVTVTAPEWQTALAPGATVDLGWIGTGPAVAPTAVSLNGLACTLTP